MDGVLTNQLDTRSLESLRQNGFDRFANCHNRINDSAKSFWKDDNSRRQKSRIIILFIGQTGSGKSTAINNLLNVDIFETNPVVSCTKNIEFIDYDIDGTGCHYITFCDMPGISESPELDKKYFSWYQKMIKMSACIVYFVKADGRAWEPDISALKKIRRKTDLSKFVFVLSQVDKVEPFREWNYSLKRPGPSQEKNILRQIENLKSQLELNNIQIIPCSTTESYNTKDLRSAIQDVIFSHL